MTLNPTAARPSAASTDMALAVDDLARTFRGAVLRPADPGFTDAASVWNLAAPSSPSLIVRPADAAAVARAVAFGQAQGLEIAVRGGGHSVAGHSTGDGVMVIDTRGLDGLAIDPARRIARVGAGLTAGVVTAATGRHGLAVPFGDTASVGVTGITLGGGIGYLARRYGLTVDSLRSLDIVTADGDQLTASATSEPELFWALRGGGGNFGVVTSLEFDLRDVSRAYGGALVLPATWNVLRGLGPIAGAAPDGLTLIANLMPAPPAPFIPADRVGTPVLVIVGVFLGDEAAGAAAWAPLRALAAPVADTVGVMPYEAVYGYTAAASLPRRSAHRALFLEGIDDDAIEAIFGAVDRAPVRQTIVQLRVLGGAISRVPADATAFAHRNAPAMAVVIADAETPDDLSAARDWVSGLHDALRTRGVGAYVNFLEDEGEARIREAYPARTYRRLAAAKAAWDPDNVFRRNQNIRPATAG